MPTCAQTVADYFKAIRSKDTERYVNLFTAEGVTHDPVGTPPHAGHAALHKFFSGITGAFESLELTEDDIFVNGQAAAVKWTGNGVGKNGKAIHFEGVDVIDCNLEGKIIQVRAFWDAEPVMAALAS